MTSGDAFQSFAGCAERYCSLIESADSLPLGRFVWAAGERLLALYVAATRLPDEEPATDEPLDRAVPSHDAFALQARLSEKLADVDPYWRLHDPFEPTERKPFEARLATDLVEVYEDVKDGLAASARGVAREDVSWHWRHWFGHHWGIHAAAALYALHWITHGAGRQWISPDDQ